MNHITNFIAPIDITNLDTQYRQDQVSTVVSLLADPQALEIIGYNEPVSQLFSLEIAITIAIRLEANQQIDPASWQAMSSLINLHFQHQRPEILQCKHFSDKPYQNLLRFVAEQIAQDQWQQLVKLSQLPNYSHYSDQITSFSPLWLDLLEMIDVFKNHKLSNKQTTDMQNTLIILVNCLIDYYF
jgi:hypothetical protein